MSASLGVRMDVGSSAAARGSGPQGRLGFEPWMAARQPALLRTACLLTGETHTAQDLVQTTLAKMYLAWDRIGGYEHVDDYARRVLLNEFRSMWRRPWRRRELSTGELPERPAAGAHYDGTSEALWAAVSTLPPKQRAVIVLRYYEELNEAETAEALGIAVGTVKSQASRALATLRAAAADHPAIWHDGTPTARARQEEQE